MALNELHALGYRNLIGIVFSESMIEREKTVSLS